MNEGIRGQFTQHEFDVQPFDGLSIFHDADFVERWITSEQHLNKLANTSPKLCDETASEDASMLNALFRTSELGGERVTVSGRILQGDEPYEIKKAVPSDKAQFRFGQIKFIKATGLIPNRPRVEQYRAAIKLLPLPEFAKAGAPSSYILLNDVKELEFSETPETVFSPAEMDSVFSKILENGKKIRSKKSYQEQSTDQQRQILDNQARQYAQRLAPLIDHRVPVMIDAAEYRKFSTKPEASGNVELVNTRDLQPNQRARKIVTGHLTKLAFSNTAIDDIAVAPHLVIENSHAREIYWVPLSTEFDIWTF